MKTETLQKLIQEFTENNKTDTGLASYITNILEKEKLIKQEMKKYNDNVWAELYRYNEKLKQLGIKLKAIQERCPHFETTFYPGFHNASGGLDSETSCDWCNKTIK